MIHQYQNNGYHIVLDVNSGSVHVVDKIAYDVIGCLEAMNPAHTPETLKEEKTAEYLLEKLGDIYAEEDLRDLLEAVAELTAAGIEIAPVELGIMVETPAAVMISEELAKEVSFFSIGTNDLTQYTLAIDRQNQSLDTIYDSHHPAILKMLKMIVDNGHKGGCWVGICGELGADTTLTETFLSMGYDELSVSPSMILKVRQEIRSLDLKA